MDKKLFIVSTGATNISMLIGYQGGMLLLQKMTRYPIKKDATAKLAANMAKYSKAGFTVAVNENIKTLSKGYGYTPLAGLDENGAPRLVAALNVYRDLEASGRIRFGNGVPFITIPDSIYERVVNDRGEVGYKIDWSAIEDESLALLVGCYNAAYHSSVSTQYLKSVFGLINQRRQQNKPKLNWSKRR